MTFSVLCWDPNTETHGVATATGMPTVGAFVPFVSAGIGAIATQGYSTNRLYGQDGLELLERGWSAIEVLDALIKRGRPRRRPRMRAVSRSSLEVDPGTLRASRNEGYEKEEEDLNEARNLRKSKKLIKDEY